MTRLPDFKEGTFLRAEDLVALVEYVRRLSDEVNQHVSLLKADIEENVGDLKARTEEEVSRLRARTEEDARHLNSRIEEDVSRLKARTDEEVSRLKAGTEEELRRLKAQIEDLRKKYEDLRREEPLPELDFNPKVLLFREAQEQALYPWSVRYKSRQGTYFDVPGNECKVEIVESSDSSAIEVRGDVLVPLRIGLSQVKVDVSFPSQNQYFEIEVKRFAR